MQSAFVAVRQSKVTLTNWERLNNAPLTLAGASAIPWNDHVFVLASDGITLLYYTKGKIWSALPKLWHSGTKTSTTSTPPALALHNGQILTMSKRGKMATFDPQFGNWIKLNDMNMKQSQTEYGCVLASYNSNLYAIVAPEKHDETASPEIPLGGSQVIQTNKDCCTIFSYDPNSKWTAVCEFGQGLLQSAAIVGGTAFVHTGGEMYKVFLEKKQAGSLFGPPSRVLTLTAKPLVAPSPTGLSPTKIDTKIASPPYVGCTLYAIKDTLFSFGGRDKDNQPTSDVLRYNPDTNTWESAGYMRSARYNVAVTTLQNTTSEPAEVFVMGGIFGSSEHTMKEPIYTSNDGALGRLVVNSYIWNSKTSIVEKCTVN